MMIYVCVCVCVYYAWMYLPTIYTLLNVQIEWLTGGDCIAGMHEVVVTNRTTDAIKLAMEQNRILWRVSSTVSISIDYCHS